MPNATLSPSVTENSVNENSATDEHSVSSAPAPAVQQDAPQQESRQRIHLRRARQEELPTLVAWSAEGTAASPFINTSRGELTVDGLRESLAGGLQLRVLATADDVPVGVATWGSCGNPRSYDVALMIADKDYWRVGLGGEAAIRVTDYLFMTMDAHRVSMRTAAYNPYTNPALSRSGYTLEGVLRDYFYLDGEFHDALVWSMLRSEHQALLDRAAGTPLAYAPTVPEQDKRKARAAVQRVLTDRRTPRVWTRDGATPEAG